MLLGETWPAAREVILPLTVMMVGAGLSVVLTAALRSLAAVRRGLRTRLALAAVTIVGGVAGVQVAGSTGAAWALAASTCAGAGAWWWQFDRALVEHERRGRGSARSPG